MCRAAVNTAFIVAVADRPTGLYQHAKAAVETTLIAAVALAVAAVDTAFTAAVADVPTVLYQRAEAAVDTTLIAAVAVVLRWISTQH
jgi:hypothetical protein